MYVAHLAKANLPHLTQLNKWLKQIYDKNNKRDKTECAHVYMHVSMCVYCVYVDMQYRCDSVSVNL